MKNGVPYIAILMLGYEDAPNLPASLSSVLGQTYRDFRLVYIDNASTDGSTGLVREQFPEVEIITEDQNLGYAGAYAKHIPGFFERGFDAVILLNSDIVADGDWLSELVTSAYRDPRIGMAMPKVYLFENGETTNRFNTSGNRVHFLGLGYSGELGKPDNGGTMSDTDVPYASGCSLLVKRETFESVGNIDADFFLYLRGSGLGMVERVSLVGISS